MSDETFWTGAEVRFTGPTELGTDAPPHGTRGVVSHTGSQPVVRYKAPSGLRKLFSQSQRLLIEFEDGRTTFVPIAYLERDGEPHPLVPSGEPGRANWFLTDLEVEQRRLRTSGGEPTVALFVPRRLPAVAMVLHPWITIGDPEESPFTWAEVSEAAGFTLEQLASNARTAEPPLGDGLDLIEQCGEFCGTTAGTLIEVLGAATSSPDDVHVALWDGWDEIPPERFPGAGRISTPTRDHVLLRGPLSATRTILSPMLWPDRPAAGLWWPSDQAWFVATDPELPWSFVAGTTELIGQLQAHPDLEALPISHDAAAGELPTQPRV